MKKIIFTRPDGGLTVLHPVRNTHPILEDLTDEQVLERAKKDIPTDATDVHIVDEVPSDRSYRDAWKSEGGQIVHCMVKSKEIHKQELRHKRKPLLEALDTEFLRALENGDSAALEIIKQKKQELRDVTKHPDITAAQSIEDLKQIKPLG